MKTILGFSLIEVMMTLILSSLIMLGLMQIYLSVKYTYQLEQGLSQIEDNGRFISNFFSKQIHLAGYAGCIKPGLKIMNDSVKGYSFNSPPNGLDKSKLRKNSDILVLKNCVEVDNKSEFVSVIYFLASYRTGNQRDPVISSLYEKIANKNAIELVPGVAGLKIRYGITKAGNIVAYQTTEQMDKNGWPDVRTVEIHLLLSSLSPTLKKPARYFFDGTEYTAHDRLLYREWITVIALRQAVTS